MVARRTETTPNGSYVALRTSADEFVTGRMSGIAGTSSAPMVPDGTANGEPKTITVVPVG
jgi:hypothetical protein